MYGRMKRVLESEVVLRLFLILLTVVAFIAIVEGVLSSIRAGSALPLFLWWTLAAVPVAVLLTVYAKPGDPGP